MQTTSKPGVPTVPSPSFPSQKQPGQAPSAPQPLAPDLLQQIAGGGPNKLW